MLAGGLRVCGYIELNTLCKWRVVFQEAAFYFFPRLFEWYSMGKNIVQWSSGQNRHKTQMKYILICLTIFWLLHDSIVLFYSFDVFTIILLDNVENSKNKEKPLNE